MHAEMRALAEAQGRTPHEPGELHPASGRPYLCDAEGEGPGRGDTCAQWFCPACAISAHAAAMRRPDRMIRLLAGDAPPPGVLMMAAQAANEAIDQYGYPLPYVPTT